MARGFADRYASIQKRKAMRLVATGIRVTSGEDLANAMTLDGGISNVRTILARKAVSEPMEVEEEDKASIKDISLYNSFTFLEDGILAKKHSLIGEGLFIPLDPKPIIMMNSFEEVPVKATVGPRKPHLRGNASAENPSSGAAKEESDSSTHRGNGGDC